MHSHGDRGNEYETSVRGQCYDVFGTQPIRTSSGFVSGTAYRAPECENGRFEDTIMCHSFPGFRVNACELGRQSSGRTRSGSVRDCGVR